MKKIERNISFKEYQNYREESGVFPSLKGLVINSSSLSDFDEEKEKDPGSGARFKYNHVENNKEKNSEAPALTFGRAIHAYVLEPETFAEDYVVEDADLHDRILSIANDEQIENKRKPSENFSKSLGAWKSFVADMRFECKEIISASMMSQIEKMTASIINEKIALDKKTVEIFKSETYETEVSIFADLKDTCGVSLPCKARLDLIDSIANGGRGLIADLKSIAEWSPGHSIQGWKWYRQMAFYLDMAKAANIVSDDCQCGWIFVEKSPPYEAQFHEAEECLIKAGRIEYQYILHRIQDCADRDVWPGHGKIKYPWNLEKKIEEVQLLT
jgi:hypothetical protein